MRDDLDMGSFDLLNVGDVKSPGGQSLIARAFCVATQSAPFGGTGAQVEIAHANLLLTQDATVKFTATLTCGPSGAGAAWNTHFQVNLDGVLRGIRGFDASPLLDNFTNVFYADLAKGTHRISLFWFGGNGLIGVGAPSPSILIAETL